MGASIFNEMELDAIGEIMNISLGASATAVSTMLGTTVNITTPVVSVLTREEFEFRRLEPAIGVEIDYVEGLDGKNIMMFRREDVGIIVGTMLGEDPPMMEELDELHISAICEVMNQMMGASATALSEFLGTVVNISTPKSFDVGDPEDFKQKYFPEKDGMVVVRFRLEIEGKLNSEFMNIMSSSLTKRLLEPFAESFAQAEAAAQAQPAPAPEPQPAPASSGSGGTMSQEEINAMLAGASGPSQPAPAPAPSSGGTMSQEEINAMLAGASGPSQPAPAPAPSSGGTMSQEEINAMLAGASGPSQPAPAPAPSSGAPQPAPQMAAAPGQPYYPYPSAGMDPMMMQMFTQMQQTQLQMMEMMKSVSASHSAPAQGQHQASGGNTIIRPVPSPSIYDEAGEGEEDRTNQEMLMKVPLEISVEIGRTKRLVRDILEFTQGTLVVLDKMAGEQVDLYVNGQCIAKGDIVVVEDNFGIRITEIVSREINPESL
ncbi:MAG: flagellar motor switch protein FliN [Hungatella sp.]|nr:flagellar motor switch protein FliN [Hungatella sp.]